MSDSPHPNRARYVWHVVSMAGHNREGTEPFPVARLRLIRLLDDVLDRFDTDPRFRHFTLDGQSILLEDYLSLRPENFERVEQAVQDGKLLVGPWYVQPELALASPEALIRNLMIGLRTARVFGPAMTVAYLPEIHLLPNYLPQLLKGFGIDTLIIPRQADDQPTEMIWEGDDGTQILLGTFSPLDDDLIAMRERLAPYSESGHLLVISQEQAGLTPVLSTIQPTPTDDSFHSNLMGYAKALASYSRSHPLPVVRGNIGVFGETIQARGLMDQWYDYSGFRRTTAHLIETMEEYFLSMECQPPSVDKTLARPQLFIQGLWREVLKDQRTLFSRNDGDHQEAKLHADRMVKLVAWLTETEPSLVADVRSSEHRFHITATKLPDDSDRAGMIVRGHNTTDEPLWVTLTPWRSFAAVDVVTLDEEPTGGKLAVEADGSIQFKAAPHRLLTFWFHD
ncbi:MAG: hypothetical protein IT324_17490 [Anaerolineae bacterium]|nr:hypothetical protein [Anaerolineae bacterium]